MWIYKIIIYLYCKQKQKGMKTFKDLKFKNHKVVPNGVQAYMEFENGSFISVVAGEGLYGSGNDSFEVMSSSTERTASGVKGWQSEKQVTAHMRYLQSLCPTFVERVYGV